MRWLEVKTRVVANPRPTSTPREFIRKGDVVRIARQQPAQPHQRRARRTRPALLLVLAPAVVVTPAAAAAIGTHASTPSSSPAVSAAQFSGPSVTSTSTTAQPASSAYTARIPDTGESGAGDDDASDAPDRTSATPLASPTPTSSPVAQQDAVGAASPTPGAADSIAERCHDAHRGDPHA